MPQVMLLSPPVCVHFEAAYSSNRSVPRKNHLFAYWTYLGCVASRPIIVLHVSQPYKLAKSPSAVSAYA